MDSLKGIRIEGLRKRYGAGDTAVDALKGVDMEVAPGEVVGLIGPSGSGKTTILRILMTLERIDSGHIRIEGEELYHMPGNGGQWPGWRG